MNNINAQIVIVRMDKLVDKLGICRSSIYEKMNSKSPRYDPGFPKPIKLGKSAMGWVESEIDEWLMLNRFKDVAL